MTVQRDSLHCQRAGLYSPLSFLYRFQDRIARRFLADLDDAVQEGTVRPFGSLSRLYVRRLDWDSRHFGFPVYRLEFADWDQNITAPYEALAGNIKKLKADLSPHGRYYLFCEVPTEDLPVLQAMGISGMRLLETRLTYYRDDVEHFAWPQRFNVRQAGQADIPGLRKVASGARNLFDRYHADPFFPKKVADTYLETFIENSINGFANIVLVPADEDGPPGAFFTATLGSEKGLSPELSVGRIVLVAVGEDRRGWHLRLMSEMSYLFRDRGVLVAHMTTQSTNRAVIRNCEKLGYRYGRCSHVFATFG
ncbi:MAG: hypothetical protein AB9866_18645 [Syntrophobacteraceae bacterium]